MFGFRELKKLRYLRINIERWAFYEVQLCNLSTGKFCRRKYQVGFERDRPQKNFVEKFPDVQSILVDQNNSVNENILKIWDKSRKKITRYPKVYEEVRSSILSKEKMTNREFAELIVETCRRHDFAESTIGLLLEKILIKK